jgi:PAS domain S-box-containing protein
MGIRKPISEAALSKKTKEVASLKKGFDLLYDHVVITDEHGNILYANQAVERNTGFSPKEIMGKNPGDLWGGNMPPDFYKRMWHTIKVEKKPFVGEVHNVRKDGKEYWQELHISPILDKNQGIKFFIAVEPSIDDQKKKEVFRKNFVSTIGKQVQEPLNATNWILQWFLANSELTEEQRKNLHKIYEHNETLVDLFNDLVYLPKQEKKIGKNPT